MEKFTNGDAFDVCWKGRRVRPGETVVIEDEQEEVKINKKKRGDK